MADQSMPVMTSMIPVADPRNAEPMVLYRSREDEIRRYDLQVEQDRYVYDLAKKRWAIVEEFEGGWRSQALKCLKFRAGEQWDQAQIAARNRDPLNPRPALTINQTGRFIRQITNAQQQNRPGGKIRPVGSGSDVDTAQTFDGLIRSILSESDWDTVCDMAFEHAVTHGKGYFRVLTDYETPWSFQQVLRVDRILNPFSVYLDPAGRKHPDYHTASYGFVIERINADHLCQRYEIPHRDWSMWAGSGDSWISKDDGIVADYYYRDELPVELVQLRNGSTRYVPVLKHPDDMPTEEEQEEQARLVDTIAWEMLRYGVAPMTQDLAGQIQNQRRSMLPIIRMCKLVGKVIVERSLFPSKYIPIIPVLGDEIDINGEMQYRGIVYDMIDAQRAYNYWTTMGAETVALAPRAPWIGTVRQFQNRPEWGLSNVQNFAFLAYNPDQLSTGQVMPPPQRQTAEPPIQAIAVARQQAQQDLYNATGLTPADLGVESATERSGRHAEVRRNESQLGTSHFRAHLSWSVRHLMRILVDAIPRVYREPDRVLRLLGKDESERTIMVHPDPQGRMQEAQMGQEIEGIYNLSVGMFDVVPDTGANYATQREEAAINLLEAANVMPKVADVMPDIIIGLQDFDGAEEAARRLRKTIPPELLDEPGSKPEEQLIMTQAQLQQTKQEAQALNALAGEQQQALQKLSQENMQLKSNRDIELRKLMQKDRELELHAAQLRLQYAQQSLDWHETVYEGNIQLAQEQMRQAGRNGSES